MAILFVGIDLAKNVFAVHGVDEHGKAVLVRPSVDISIDLVPVREFANMEVVHVLDLSGSGD